MGMGDHAHLHTWGRQPPNEESHGWSGCRILPFRVIGPCLEASGRFSHGCRHQGPRSPCFVVWGLESKSFSRVVVIRQIQGLALSEGNRTTLPNLIVSMGREDP